MPQTTKYHVWGLCCTEEGQSLRKQLEKQQGVDSVSVDVIGQSVTVSYSCSNDDVSSTIRRAGFNVSSHDDEHEHVTSTEYRKQTLFTAIAGGLLVLGLIAEYTGAPHGITVSLFAAAIVSGGWKIAVMGYHGLRRLSLDMNFLMTVAAIGAVSIGKWGEGAMVIVLFSVSLLIEGYSIRRTRKAITDLLSIAPAEARVVRNGKEEIINVRDVRIGENLIILPGERIPVDGTVINGESSVNQAPITGESVPVMKRAGDTVFAGSLNERG
jgi:Cd2+/Zn2+-exporting ATPase